MTAKNPQNAAPTDKNEAQTGMIELVEMPTGLLNVLKETFLGLPSGAFHATPVVQVFSLMQALQSARVVANAGHTQTGARQSEG